MTVNNFSQITKDTSCKNTCPNLEPLPQNVCHYRGPVPVASLLPGTFANFYQLVNAKRSWGLITKPGDKLAVDGFCLMVSYTFRPFLLAAFGHLTAWHGFLWGVWSSRRAKGRDGNTPSPGWGTWPKDLKVHISKLLSVWPSPIYTTQTCT